MQLVQKIKNTFWHYPKNTLLNLYYGQPSKNLVLIGVTGTDGKTTTCNLLHHILLKNGLKAGVISTIGAKIGTDDYKTKLHMTSPDPRIIYRLLRKMTDAGVTHVVLEVTAHALDQYRYLGCNFEIGVITNTSHEHLDDFRSMDDYTRAKAKLFKNCKIAILNKDDPSYEIIKPLTSGKIISYAIDTKATFRATDIKMGKSLLGFNIYDTRIITDSNYHHQIYNILAAYAVSQELNLDCKLFLKTVRHFPVIKGRREELPNKYKFRTIIDFAHTPAALDDTLKSLRKNTPGRLMVIFGATGGRDKTKRPLMGQIVSQVADLAFITADDTRMEDINDINAQIISGVDNSNPKFKYFNIPSRQDAFNLAVKMAEAGDTIIACGKGHETSILHGTTEYPWSEAEAFRTAFRLRSSS